MTAYYEEIMELWKAGEFFDAIRYFSDWISKGLIGQEEIESFNKNLSEFWELVEVECQTNAEVLFNLYKMVRKTRNWGDETLRKKLKISDKAIEDIENHHKPGSEAVGLKMLYGLFPQMAV
jgi:DNA-binding XRE family transcriptional regulator